MRINVVKAHLAGGRVLSNQNPNPGDWNRGYTVGSGKSPVVFWLGMAFVAFVFGLALYGWLMR